MHTDEELIDQTIALASSWQTYANSLHLEFDKEFYSIMNSIQQYPQDKILLIELLQTVFVSENNKRMAHLIDYLLEKYGIAEFFTNTQKTLLWLFQHSTKNIPDISMPFFKEYLQKETERLLVYEDNLDAFLERKDYQEVKTTVNLLHGLTMNELEAQRASENYIRELGNSYVETLSVKVSMITSDLDLTDFDKSVQKVVHQLALIFRQSLKFHYKGSVKRVILDMEESTYLPIIIESFKKVLQKEEFKTVKAGITLQSYLIDGYDILEDLLQWAKARHESGGEKIVIRLVKGSFLKKEYSTSLVKPLPLVTFTQKVYTDAQYKKMACKLLLSSYEEICEVNIATHNLFDLAYLYSVAKNNNQLFRTHFEMFEGLNESLKVAIEAQNKEVITYSSVLLKNDFTNGVDFLLKRISDLTSQCSFLSHAYRLKIDSDNWIEYKKTFLESLKLVDKPLPHKKSFLYSHEPVTDFREHKSRVWLKNSLEIHNRNYKPNKALNESELEIFLNHSRVDLFLVDFDEQRVWLHQLIELVREKRKSFIFALKKDVLTNDKEISLCIDTLKMLIQQLEYLEASYSFESEESRLYTLYVDETFSFHDIITMVCSILLSGHRVLLKGTTHTASLLFALEELFEESCLKPYSFFCMIEEKSEEKQHSKYTILKNKSVKKAFYISDISNKELAVRTVFNSSLKHCVDYWGSITLILQEDVYRSEKFLQRLVNSKNIKDKNIIFNNKQIETVSVKNIHEAVAYINSNDAFMSASIESLDEEEIEYFTKECNTEHLYVNKTVECESKYILTTPQMQHDFFLPKCGLEVLSLLELFMTIAPKKKDTATKHNYLKVVDKLGLEESIKESLNATITSYESAFHDCFHLEHEYEHIEIEKHIIQYIPFKKVLIVMDEMADIEMLLSRIFACKTAKVEFVLWCQSNQELFGFCEQHKGLLFDTPDAVLLQSKKELEQAMLHCDKILLNSVQDSFNKATDARVRIKAVSKDGQLELNNYFYEQRLYSLVHKYGIKLDHIKANNCWQI